ncbi:tRNA epoxyqueuosine(34) reductase QueG [Paenibacillus ginsengarvi]|uniref:Epoxyqueuosine reductase n=1 Tax=Paenibacillus ginsengarvi TaxID=400777 RepID=A0A3B0BG64_9BACL|nr:tRNA epoxyqueuosine(34) reductase QueG [Paenibacillus ginsengarvi]RKN71269.1 tRNA epoxyqueuosine(34) reductase QueG [Paenibacillus ginsengarvi]
MEKAAYDSKDYYAQLKEDIRAAAPELGIDKIGFASAEPFVELKQILIQHRERGYESGFEEPDLEKRTDPALSLERPQSLVSIAIAYPSKLKDAPKSAPGAYRGIISRSSWGEDYHKVLRKRIAALEEYIKERVPEARIESMVDTGSLSDRAVAQRAGIGWSGKNCAIITPEWGSWVYLGELITSIPFPPDRPITDQCGDCTICIDACPTGALVGPGQLNSSRCISFVTQTKGFVSEEMMRKIGNRLYGCDTCQVVCPVNKGKNWTHQPDLQPEPEKVKPLLKPLLSLSNKQFRELYGHLAASWRGRKPIQRNALIALGNFRDETAVPLLSDVMRTDERPELRAAAAWALGRIGGDEARSALEQAKRTEAHPVAAEYMETALKAIAGVDGGASDMYP